MTMLIGASGLALAPQVQAATTILDFSRSICGGAGNAPCNDGTQIGQNYGDSAAVDVSYRSITASTGVTFESFLKHWGPNYGNLTSVVWGGADGSNYISEIKFMPSAGFEVALLGFDAACYLNRVSCQTLNYGITSGVGAAIASGSSALLSGSSSAIAVNSAYFSDGIVLKWGPDGYDAGLDNIRFDARAITAAVPEPATWAMMILGFGLIGGAMRRRSGLGASAMA